MSINDYCPSPTRHYAVKLFPQPSKPVIVAGYQGHTVEIESVYECGGVKLASVRALAGEPFVAGLKWPVRSAYGVVRVSELTNACYAWMTGKVLHLQKAAEVG